MKIRNTATDNFFYKYFNDNVKNESFIEEINDLLYIEVNEQIKEFSEKGKIDYNTFTFILSKKINFNKYDKK